MSDELDIDIPDPLAYAHSTVDAESVLKDLGFKYEGHTASGKKVWTKMQGRIWHSVFVDPDSDKVQYRKLRKEKTEEIERGILGKRPYKMLVNVEVPVSQVRRYVMKWHTEAVEVIEHLIDGNPDALDPRADLEHLLDRCPGCGSSNITESEDEELADCFNCGIWFDPLVEDGEIPPEDEVVDIKAYAMQHGTKPYGYVLRSRNKDSIHPWMNRRWSDASDCCGNFRRYIGDATVYKRSPKGYDLDVVPVYSDPRKTGEWALNPAYFRESLHEDDEIGDYKAYAMKHGLPPRITITFSRTTPESVEHGDFSDSGYLEEEGVSMEPDDIDQEEGLTVIDKAADFLDDHGAHEPSSSEFHPGVWYSDGWSTIDYTTGTEEERNYHLEGFTPEQEREVWEKLREIRQARRR